MALRLPDVKFARSPTEPAMCERVLGIVHQRCGALVDRERLDHLCDADPALRRYVRDVLGLFASLDQVEHVRRDLWIIPPIVPPPDRELEYLRAAAATRACGAWFVVAGAWSLMLHGVLSPDSLPGVRSGLSPRPARPATYAAGGRQRRDTLPRSVTTLGNEHRHVTVIHHTPVATITRPADRLGDVETLELAGYEVHAQSIAASFVTMFEHPRLSGGCAGTAHAVLPVLGRVGIRAVIRAAAAHPSVAVRRRVAFVLVEAIRRSEGFTCWFGEDELGLCDDFEQSWRIDRELQVCAGGRPTMLDPHRLPIGRRIRRFALVDNRDAPLAGPTRGPHGVSLHEQARRVQERERARSQERALARARAEDEELERLLADRARRRAK